LNWVVHANAIVINGRPKQIGKKPESDTFPDPGHTVRPLQPKRFERLEDEYLKNHTGKTPIQIQSALDILQSALDRFQMQ
jgi:hypothetical protein